MLFRLQSTIGWQLFFARWILMSSLLDMMNHVLRSVHKLHNHFWGSLWDQSKIVLLCFSHIEFIMKHKIHHHHNHYDHQHGHPPHHHHQGSLQEMAQKMVSVATTSHAARTACFTLPTQFALQYQCNACSYIHNIIPMPQIPAMFLSITTSKRFKAVMYLLALAITMAWYLLICNCCIMCFSNCFFTLGQSRPTAGKA